MKSAIKSFKSRVQWLSTLSASAPAAALSLIRAKLTPQTIAGQGMYKQIPFIYRGIDLSALKEVLIDNEYAFLKNKITQKENPQILDIGAHIGTFALWALAENPKAQILSVEADPQTYKILSTTIGKNTKYNWSAINRAAWKNDGEISFNNISINGDSMGHKISNQGSISVKGITLENLIPEDKKFDLVKIDIEGAGEELLFANPEKIKNIECLVIEIHQKYCSLNKIEALLQENFSRVTSIQGRTSSKPLLYCQK